MDIIELKARLKESESELLTLRINLVSNRTTMKDVDRFELQVLEVASLKLQIAAQLDYETKNSPIFNQQ